MWTVVDTTFKITETKLYVPIVTLSSKDNVKLTKLSNFLEKGFKRPVIRMSTKQIKKSW